MQEHIIDALATYRLTKLVIDDEITAEAREKLEDHLSAHPGKLSDKVSYLITCPWCVSIWAGAGVKVLRLASPKAANVVSGFLAASAITGLIYNHLD